MTEAIEMTIHDKWLIRAVLPSWFAKREWAKGLLMEHMDISKPEEMISKHFYESGEIGNSGYKFRVHGPGVEVHHPETNEGIDFEFFDHGPDWYRLYAFIIREGERGALNDNYSYLFKDTKKLKHIMLKLVGYDGFFKCTETDCEWEEEYLN